MYDLVVANCQLVREDRVVACSLAIRGDRVAAILGPEDDPGPASAIDAGGRFVIPGIIDTHVHLGNAGRPFDEDCRSESRAAATGGVTTMVVFAVTQGSYDELMPHLKDSVRSNSLVDVMFHVAIVNPQQIGEIQAIAQNHDIRSFKAYMAYKGGDKSPSGAQGIEDGELYAFFCEVAKAAAHAVVHCENIELIRWAQRPFIEAGRRDTAAWSDSRPAFGEIEAIRRASELAGAAGANMTVAHLSVGADTEFLKEKKIGGGSRTVETCPHYLVLDKDTDIGPAGKVNPPLRDRRQIEALWERMADGTIDMIGSDHCPYTVEGKGDDLWTARAGITGGVAMILPILYTEGVMKGRISLHDLVSLCAASPAKALGIYPRKGALDVGSDADLVVLDADTEFEVTPDSLNTVSDYTPYDGMTLRGRPWLTIAGGEIVFSNGEVGSRNSPARVVY